MSDTDATYLIWSHEHDAWWKPHRLGYTHSFTEAGHYTEADAQRICENACYRWLQGLIPPYGDLPAEVMVSACDNPDDAEVAELIQQRLREATQAAIRSRGKQREAAS